MDFPISVPGVGLVGGRFIDENPVTGQQGSLLTAQWGNQLTDEILNVIKVASANDPDNPDFIPSETQSNQLALAIQKIVADAVAGVGNTWGNLEDKPLAITSLLSIITLNSTTTLSNEQLGIVLIDASASDIAITLPLSNQANKAVRVTLFRLDNSTHKVTVKAATGENINFHTKRGVSGYGFFYLMGAGDYWQLMADGNKSWFKLNRLDGTALGRINFDASTEVPEGGYLIANGSLLSRSEYPWLWDFAQQSAMLVDEAARVGMEGCFTIGDGSTTFRIPDLRGEFIRALDSSRGIDVDRVAGSWQADEFKSHVHPSIKMTTGIVAYPGSILAGAVDDFTGEAGGNETRPRNIAYSVFIKIM